MKKALQFIMALFVVAGCSKLDMITGEIADGIGVGLSSNGVTVMCKDLPIGAKFYSVKLEKEFEVVDNDLLRQRVSEGADLSCLCTSNVTDMTGMFAVYANNGGEQSIHLFNQDLSVWDVKNVTQCYEFIVYEPNWKLPKPNFTSCNPNSIQNLSIGNEQSILKIRKQETPFDEDVINSDF